MAVSENYWDYAHLPTSYVSGMSNKKVQQWTMEELTRVMGVSPFLTAMAGTKKVVEEQNNILLLLEDV